MRNQLLMGDRDSGSVDERMTAGMRVILASLALAITYADPSEPDRFVTLTYSCLCLYTVYSALIYGTVHRRRALAAGIQRWLHWADVAWYLLLISLSSGTNSIFFFFFFFPILNASFRHGFASGLRVALASSVLFIFIGSLTLQGEGQFELNRFLLRPVFLLAFGYMMAYWGGFEMSLMRKLALLKEVSVLSNPRFGVDRTIGQILIRLLDYYGADSCLLIEFDPDSSEHKSRRADRNDPEGGMRAHKAPEELGRKLLSLPADLAIAYSGRTSWNGWVPDYYALDVTGCERRYEGREPAEAAAQALDAVSLLTIPLHQHNESMGRLYLVSSKPRAFGLADVEFLLQVIRQVIPVLDNIRLVDRLASDAAEEERHKLARNIHDSIIQPYLALQIGLTGIRQKLAACAERSGSNGTPDSDTLPELNMRIEKLIEMTSLGVQELRDYVQGLKSVGESEGSLLPALRRFAGKFSDATGIAVDVHADGDVPVNDRLAAETFQMVAEGLSNIRRHTRAGRAAVRLACRAGSLVLLIENESSNGHAGKVFIPRSISERAESIGGQARVERTGERTIVEVEIPL